MKRLLLLSTLFLCFAFAFKQIEVYQHQESKKICNLNQNWTSPIGNVSFRTNIAYLNGDIVIGSNGGNYMDYFLDKGNGINVLDPITGKIKWSFANERFGDMDVNGVLVYDNRIYFGNDNDEIICADSKGKIIFRQDASGDIEHRPILLNSPAGDQIVFAMETGEVRSINPISGKINWTYYHPEFDGFKVNDNRTTFKLKMHFYSGDRFFLEPKVIDINKDNVKDL
jgi:outer membrane protein assembly factor BamB